MCYSAQLQTDFRRHLNLGGSLSLRDFSRLYRERPEKKHKIPRAIDRWFLSLAENVAGEVQAAIRSYDDARMRQWEQDLFTQRKRLADAERQLGLRPSRAAEETKRVATAKTQQLLRWIESLRTDDPADGDGRIFPKSYAPVMVVQDGRRLIVPMRYQCLLAGKPSSYDLRYPGTYNARRDNLEGYWRPLFGRYHGVLLATDFFEHVAGDGGNQILRFHPRGADQLLVACLWSEWRGPAGDTLLSFAAITDEPPEEVAAAGHDRCVVPLREEHLDDWLSPNGNVRRAYEILDDRHRPYYESRLAA